MKYKIAIVGPKDTVLGFKALGLKTHNALTTEDAVKVLFELKKEVTVDEVNAAVKAAAEGGLKGILEYCDEPIASSDILGNPASSVFDSLCTMVMGKIVKVISWYDNEWGYSNRTVDIMEKVAKM